MLPATLGSMGDDGRRTDSGIELRPIYRAADLEGVDPDRDLGRPGEPPFTRGVRPEMYRERLWTMRQYAGMGTAEETNERFRYLLEHGQTGLSVAFDLPTQMGLDSDHPRAEGEVGRTGVAIDTIDDMRRLFDRIPLERVSTSMTINATAPILLLLYELVAEERGIEASTLSGTVQNDVLKEYAARGTYIYPPAPSMRLITDLFAYCGERIPRWNTISISGYHMREAGATAVQELAFTLANGIAYVQAALDAGLAVDDFAPHVSFFFACHMNFFEEVAKFRAARRMWARIMADRFGATNPRSLMLRFHTQTGGATLIAQQPETNVVRTALEALAAVLGGTQSLHTNAFDEALGLPTERAAKTALRTQQVIGHETGVASVADPLGGAYFVEALTGEVEDGAKRVPRAHRAHGRRRGRDRGRLLPGRDPRGRVPDPGGHRVRRARRRGPEPLRRRGRAPRRAAAPGRGGGGPAARPAPGVPGRPRRPAPSRAALDEVEHVARGDGNLLPPMREALRRTGHPGRGLGRAARGVRRVPPARLRLR